MDERPLDISLDTNDSEEEEEEFEDDAADPDSPSEELDDDGACPYTPVSVAIAVGDWAGGAAMTVEYSLSVAAKRGVAGDWAIGITDEYSLSAVVSVPEIAVV